MFSKILTISIFIFTGVTYLKVSTKPFNVGECVVHISDPGKARITRVTDGGGILGELLSPAEFKGQKLFFKVSDQSALIKVPCNN
jgi:hypothetical protein